MPFSYVTRSGDGNTTSFTFSFTGQDEGYIREENIVVLVDGASVPFVLTSANTLETDTAPPLDSEVLIRRVMPKQTPYADFQRGNNFGQEVLNNSFLQLLYVVHELLDGWFPAGFTVREAVTFLEELLVDSNLHVNGGLTTNGANSNDPDSVVTFEYLAEVVSNYQFADANLQSQITGTTPLEASAFSEISWHGQEIKNSVVIPPNKNAWSFGPSMAIEEGQAVTVSEGSSWTIANGDGDVMDISYDGGEL